MEIVLERKKELKEEYKNLKPDIGIIAIKSKISLKHLILCSQNIKASINRAKFQLNHGSYPNKELQNEWKENGENSFEINILEELSYDEDDTKTDYSEDLEILGMIWKERLKEEEIEFYKD